MWLVWEGGASSSALTPRRLTKVLVICPRPDFFLTVPSKWSFYFMCDCKNLRTKKELVFKTGDLMEYRHCKLK